jgi:hypothetical protein
MTEQLAKKLYCADCAAKNMQPYGNGEPAAARCQNREGCPSLISERHCSCMSSAPWPLHVIQRVASSHEAQNLSTQTLHTTLGDSVDCALYRLASITNCSGMSDVSNQRIPADLTVMYAIKSSLKATELLHVLRLHGLSLSHHFAVQHHVLIVQSILLLDLVRCAPLSQPLLRLWPP